MAKNLPQASDVVSYLGEVPELFAERTFLIDGVSGKRWTYKEFRALALSVQEKLWQRGLRRGDRLGVMSDNGVELATLYFAALYSGITVVPLNPALRQQDLEPLLAAARVKELAYAERLTDFQVAATQLPVPHFGLETLVHSPAVSGSSFVQETPAPRDELIIIFTSGTTARPKAVAHSYEHVVGNAQTFAALYGVGPDNRFYNYLPMTYLGGYYNLMLLPFLHGASVVIAPTYSAASVLNFWKPMRDFEVNTIWLVPTIIALLLKMDRGNLGEEYAAKNVKLCLCGTAPLLVPMKEAFEKRYSQKIHENFGLSELLFITAERPLPKTHQGVGAALPAIEVKVVRDSGETLPAGEEGEVLVKSPHLMNGYLNYDDGRSYIMPLVDGWFATGDLGVMDAQGNLRISGRKKDLIIKGGYNISPAELEEILSVHPMVKECAVVGVPHPIMGEDVAAIVALTTHDDAEIKKAQDEILQLCKTKLAKTKWPAHILHLADFPHTTSGKIQKNKLRLWAAQQLGL